MGAGKWWWRWKGIDYSSSFYWWRIVEGYSYLLCGRKIWVRGTSTISIEKTGASYVFPLYFLAVVANGRKNRVFNAVPFSHRLATHMRIRPIPTRNCELIIWLLLSEVEAHSKEVGRCNWKCCREVHRCFLTCLLLWLIMLMMLLREYFLP